jgi:hypothetical protein
MKILFDFGSIINCSNQIPGTIRERQKVIA